jgi:hypothetical protein
MSKPIHPIRKMLRALDLHQVAAPSYYQRAVARHVKPLLDALIVLHGLSYDHSVGNSAAPWCPECDLIAKWRAKL